MQHYPRITATRAFEELKRSGYDGGYTILRDRIRQLRVRPAKPLTVRFETAPGVQAQMDWATYEIDFTQEGKRRVNLFSYLLGYSRRQYIHFIQRQDFDTTVRQHIEAFEHLGGVAAVCLYDNMKVAVTRWEDDSPVYNTRFLAFATHYGYKPWACQVDSEGTILYATNRYSVPWQLVGEQLPVRITAEAVIVYNRSLSEIARHGLLQGQSNQRRMDPRHAPPRDHEAQMERLRERFAELGEIGTRYLEGLQGKQRCAKHQAQKILALLHGYPKSDVVAAMDRAVQYHAYGFTSLERILAHQGTPKPAWQQLSESGQESFRRLAESEPIGPRHSQGIGRACCALGHRVRHVTSASLLEDLTAGAGEKTLPAKIRFYRSFDLLIIDEFGFDKLERREYSESLSLLYKVVDSRNGRGSTAFVTNVDFTDWSDYLGDPPLIMALLDRVVDRAIVLGFAGKSYRKHRAEQKQQAVPKQPT